LIVIDGENRYKIIDDHDRCEWVNVWTAGKVSGL